MEEYTEKEAIQAIEDIAKSEQENNEILNEIESDLTDIDEHITNIDEYLVINNKEEEQKNEQESEKIDGKENQKSGEGEQEQEEVQAVTLDDIYNEVAEVNDNIENTNSLLTVGVWSQGIIIGVLLLTIFWRKFFK